MELSIFELSKHLGVAQDTIERWIRQGKIPVSKKGSNYRFRADELEKWAVKHNINLNLSIKVTIEKEPLLPLSIAVQNGGIYFDIQGNDVNSVLESCVDKISKIPDGIKADLVDSLINREQVISTGIGNGVAIPHPREQLSYLESPIVSICFLANQVDYKALDNQPVSVLFLILCPELKMHLHLLSVLSFCLRAPQFIDFLKSKPNPEQLIEKIEVLQKANPT
ncbi:MAG: PTS transporter subunit EIIA [Desulfobacteraceae bacterium]|nr:PTS transporter subunit EIIA [Desulfobacteraceae bacterium]